MLFENANNMPASSGLPAGTRPRTALALAPAARAASTETLGAYDLISNVRTCVKITLATTTKMDPAKFWQKIMKATHTGIFCAGSTFCKAIIPCR